jgi:hypothetical protein
MGCGCKKKKQAALTNNQPGVSNTNEEVDQRKKLVQEQQDYQTNVRDALKQLIDIKRKKQNLRRK